MYLAAFVISLAVALCAADHSEGHLQFRLTVNESCANANGSTVPTGPVPIDLEDSPTVVQDVMELAADVRDFKFTVTYYDGDYTIDSLSGLENAKDCQWYLFYRAPDDDKDKFESDPISSFVVAPNSTVTLSYEREPVVPPSPSPSPSPAPSPKPRDNGAAAGSSFSVLPVVICVLVGAVMFQ